MENRLAAGQTAQGFQTCGNELLRTYVPDNGSPLTLCGRCGQQTSTCLIRNVDFQHGGAQAFTMGVEGE